MLFRVFGSGSKIVLGSTHYSATIFIDKPWVQVQVGLRVFKLRDGASRGRFVGQSVGRKF